MNEVVSVAEAGERTADATLRQRLARGLLFKRLGGLRDGALTVVEGCERHRFGDVASDDSLQATIRVEDPRFYSRIALGGSLGAAEAYMDGLWLCDDLTALVRVMVRNRDALEGMERGLARLAAPLRRLVHFFDRNTMAGSRRNIAAHYDLGNEFFALFLDETMMYSCAVFERPDMSLAEASRAKLERICRKLELSPSDHVLEIGTGWGGFAIHAAARFGCRVTTATISQQQFELAQRRIAEAGLQDLITVVLRDYRALEGRFDKLVSIEMIEAVGHHYFDAFFRRCGELLKPDGMMLLQAITIADRHYRAARDSVDFIKRYIFPGSCIPSVTAMCESIARASDLRLFHLEDITAHYAITLRNWRSRFVEHIDRVRNLGYSKEFIRMWEFYLCYCEGGFLERYIGDVQMLLTKPRCRRPPIAPMLDPMPRFASTI